MKMGSIRVLFLLALLGFSPQTAQGHAFSERAEPKVGAVLAASPDHVRLWFDSFLEPAFSTITVHNAAGAVVDNKDGRVSPTNGKMLEVSVPRLPPGAYRVIWSVVARDGHRTSGDYSFVIK